MNTIINRCFLPEHSKDEYLHNPGCGISYLQRRSKIPYSQVPGNSWFFRENLTDQLAIDVPWSVLEPEEGRYEWKGAEWEGCFQSWIDAGFRVHLKIRGMDTLGSFYNDGTPQWVFDAGANYVDDPIELYRQNKALLNDIPSDGVFPIRYPVFWDPVYIEKSELLIHEFGKRYNGHSAVESVSIAHVGRWGEMHLGCIAPAESWHAAGFNIDLYQQTVIRFIDIYLAAFPDTQLSLSIGRPLYPEYSYCDIMDVLDYAAAHGVILKFDGLGNYNEEISNIFKKNLYKTKLAFENLVLPEALEYALKHGISYWQRGGESPGLGIMRVSEDIPLKDKRIFSWYNNFSNAGKYDRLSIEQQKDCFRMMARQCGYKLRLESCAIPKILFSKQTFLTHFEWYNVGSAPCYEMFEVKLQLVDPESEQVVWTGRQSPCKKCSPEIWDAGAKVCDELCWLLPSGLTPGTYILQIGLETIRYQRRMMCLDIDCRQPDGMYRIGDVNVI